MQQNARLLLSEACSLNQETAAVLSVLTETARDMRGSSEDATWQLRSSASVRECSLSKPVPVMTVKCFGAPR